MDKIFGIPATNLALVMSSLLLIIIVIVSVAGIRRRILVRMRTRNIPRRKGQSILIIIGLMLSSTIVATSLGIGDTVRYSIRSVVLDSLGTVDERISGPGKQLFGDEYFDYSEFLFVKEITQDFDKIDDLQPYIETKLPVSNDRSGLAESNMNIRGLELTNSKEKLLNIENEIVSVDDLDSKTVYVNSEASKDINIEAGDKLSIFTSTGPTEYIVSDILKSEGVAGGETFPTVIFELETLQKLLGKENQITNIFVSNVGNGDNSIDLSDEVTKFLRSELTNQDVASEIFNTLQSNGIPNLISEEAKEIQQTDNETYEDLIQLSTNLENDEFNIDFITGISSYTTQLLILGILEKSGLQKEAASILKLSSGLTRLRVEETKSDGVRLAENVSSGITSIFTIFGSFSIMVGMLLIFLVFVLLAAARSTELGMARAVGLKRRDLIQLFTYEGTVYSFLAAMVGTLIGIGLSFALVIVLQDIIGEDVFSISPSYSITSLLIAFSSGLILTFITVVFSAYRASNLNIVVAIRGLKDEFVKKPPESRRNRMINVLRNIIYPIKTLIAIVTKSGKLRNIVNLIFLPISWPFSLIKSLFILFGKQSYILLAIFSLMLIILGIQTETLANFSLGLIGGALAVGLFIRFIASKFINDPETVGQIGGTFEGGLVLLCSSLPGDVLEPITGELTQPGPWFWPLGGGISTAAAVWLLMSNTKILIFILNIILSRFSGLKAVTKTAISYPMASKFRTGLTVAMFALIIFTLMIFSILNGLNDVSLDQPDRVTGGYDIKATISTDLPISGNIEDSLNMSEISSVAGTSSIRVDVKELSGENNSYKGSRLISLDDSFLKSTKWRMAHIDESYGSTDREIWEALMSDPNLVVASGSIIASGDPFGPPDRSFKTSFIEREDPREIESFSVQMKKTRSSEDPTELTVIGVVERLAAEIDGFGGGGATFYSKESLTKIVAKEDIPIDTYYFAINDKDNAPEYAQKLEKTFLANGMNTQSLMQNIEDQRAAGNSFNKLFQGFSGLGLVVGVAAIGVLSVRAVVERRQSIGVLRAIGFKSSMIRAQFLIESSFITLLGIFVGIGLGTLQSWLIFLEISKELEDAKFAVPIGEVGILIIITVVASILASVIPANEASKTYPAEALRYE